MNTAQAIILAITVAWGTIFMIASYSLKQSTLAFMGALGWILTAIHARAFYTTVWDIYYTISWVSVFIMVVCMCEPVIVSESREKIIAFVSSRRKPREEDDSLSEYEENYEKATGRQKRNSQRRRPRSSESMRVS